MRNFIFIIILNIITFSCSSKYINQNQCIENIEFKQKFYDSIEIINIFITGKYKKPEEYYLYKKKYKKSLKFLSKYVNITWSSMYNYNRSYPYGVFKEDRTRWIEWYEENRCNNIQ